MDRAYRISFTTSVSYSCKSLWIRVCAPGGIGFECQCGFHIHPMDLAYTVVEFYIHLKKSAYKISLCKKQKYFIETVLFIEKYLFILGFFF